ncbi:TPA: inorganic pyrophosphatase, partial [Neisseria gonorrhoeae]
MCYTFKLQTFPNKGNQMADFNQILTPGDVDGGIINVVNEIPAGSN